MMMRFRNLAFSVSAFLACLGLAVPGFAQDDPQTRPDAAPGAIIMYRAGSIFGAALGCPIRYRGAEVVELGRNKYAEWKVPAGRYVLVNNTASVEVTVDPGEASYVRCQIKTGFMTGRSDLQIVDRETFMRQGGAGMERKDALVKLRLPAAAQVSATAPPPKPAQPVAQPSPAPTQRSAVRCETCR